MRSLDKYAGAMFWGSFLTTWTGLALSYGFSVAGGEFDLSYFTEVPDTQDGRFNAALFALFGISATLGLSSIVFLAASKRGTNSNTSTSHWRQAGPGVDDQV